MANDPEELTVEDRLDLWLQAATRGLSNEAARRVGEEVTDHVLSAMEEAASQGLDEVKAGHAAVDALGDSERAGRALRRANLRPWEAKIVGSLAEPVPLWAHVLYWVLIPAFVAINLGHIDTQGRSLLFAACLLGMFGGNAARFWIARRLARAGRLRAALVADVFGPWIYFAALVVGTNLLQPGQDEWAPVTYLGILIALGVFVAYLWPKIGRRGPASTP